MRLVPTCILLYSDYSNYCFFIRNAVDGLFLIILRMNNICIIVRPFCLVIPIPYLFLSIYWVVSHWPLSPSVCWKLWLLDAGAGEWRLLELGKWVLQSEVPKGAGKFGCFQGPWRTGALKKCCCNLCRDGLAWGGGPQCGIFSQVPKSLVVLSEHSYSFE